MTSTSINWYVTAGTLRAAFELRTREPDQHGNSSEYYAFTREARQSTDDLTEFVRELHDEEWPNDWRYQIIVQILDALIEDSEYVSGSDPWLGWDMSVAERLTSVYTSELAAWFAENPSRTSYHEEAIKESLVEYEASLSDRLMLAQNMCIRQMAEKIARKLGLEID
jgi:hypothetical protein